MKKFIAKLIKFPFLGIGYFVFLLATLFYSICILIDLTTIDDHSDDFVTEWIKNYRWNTEVTSLGINIVEFQKKIDKHNKI